MCSVKLNKLFFCTFCLISYHWQWSAITQRHLGCLTGFIFVKSYIYADELCSGVLNLELYTYRKQVNSSAFIYRSVS